LAGDFGTFAVQTTGATTNLTWTPHPILVWRTQKFGSNAANLSLSGNLADPDNDGLANLIEFVIGGQPDPSNAGADSSRLSPTAAVVGEEFVFTFRRSTISLSQPGIGINVEYGSELTGWQTAVTGVNGVTSSVISGIESGVDEVSVRIPRSFVPGPKFFARLNVMIP
jgi:hypothetical protein